MVKGPMAVQGKRACSMPKPCGARMGAALALAETLFKMDKDLASSFTGELQRGATDAHWPVRH